MNKTTPVLLAIILAAVPKTTVQAAASTTSPVVQRISQSIISTDLQLVTNQVEPLSVDPITLNTVVVDNTPKAHSTPQTISQFAEKMVAAKFGQGQFKAFSAIVQHESGWNPNAVNRSSGACGLGQALPCSKIPDKSVTGQLTWMMDYISDRYGTPAHAWKFWQNKHWY
ncbi:MAG: transglycosylase SLT domain-containing protein [bacterium]